VSVWGFNAKAIRTLKGGVIALRPTQILIIIDSPVFNTVRRFKNLKVSLSISPMLSTEPRKCSGETSIGETIDTGGKKGGND
jgi:hypothetical protein